MRRTIAAVLGLVLALMVPTVALADHIEGKADWYVEYNEAGRLVDNYTQREWADNVSQLQPGDDITLTVEIRQTNEDPADWYMSNEVLKSLEDNDASGSAYGYKLSYKGPSNSRTLYESKSVGGKGSADGLAEATNAMDEYFYLGPLSNGETGKVILNVTLDGETEGNAYFDTLARLALKFAVEPEVEPKKTTVNIESKEYMDSPTTVTVTRRNLAKTGDESMLFPVYLAIAGVGIVCLVLGIRNMRNKNDEEEDE
jgi:hypothetical protein